MDNQQENRKNNAHTEWVFVLIGGGSILFVIIYWVLRASSYSYTDVIYITADYDYGKYFGAAFDTVCGVLPALLVGIPTLARVFWFQSKKNHQLSQPLSEVAQSNESDAKINP